MILTDASGRLLFCSPAQPARCADSTHSRQLGLVKHLTDGPPVEILADAGYQGLGAQTGGRVVTPPHRKSKKNPPAWYEEIYERQRKAHSSRRIRVEHGIAHLKKWRALARHHGRREHMSDTVQAVAGLLSHRQTATHTDREGCCWPGRPAPFDVAPITVHELVTRVAASRSSASPLRSLPRLHHSHGLPPNLGDRRATRGAGPPPSSPPGRAGAPVGWWTVRQCSPPWQRVRRGRALRAGLRRRERPSPLEVDAR
ncbi:transposase family protein [Streptomyces sp. NPDC056056]|uniref:transposase family protein n=1 Tax=Streptomyces sp. NPDC056056 TaxID=3345698 RepID=UPI0035D782DF